MSTACHYPTDVRDAQWEALQLVLPPPKWRPGGPERKPMDLRRVINGIFYVNKTGCQWRMMPTNIGNGHTIYPRRPSLTTLPVTGGCTLRRH
jgi:putative transposase